MGVLFLLGNFLGSILLANEPSPVTCTIIDKGGTIESRYESILDDIEKSSGLLVCTENLSQSIDNILALIGPVVAGRFVYHRLVDIPDDVLDPYFKNALPRVHWSAIEREEFLLVCLESSQCGAPSTNGFFFVEGVSFDKIQRVLSYWDSIQKEGALISHAEQVDGGELLSKFRHEVSYLTPSVVFGFQRTTDVLEVNFFLSSNEDVCWIVNMVDSDGSVEITGFRRFDGPEDYQICS